MSAGRPAVITRDVLRKLEEAFLVGASDLEACYLANISKTALYEYQKQNSEFAERKEGLKAMLKYRARVNLSKQINKGSIDVSKWYLERKSKEEFGTKVSVDQEVKVAQSRVFTDELRLKIAKRIIEQENVHSA